MRVITAPNKYIPEKNDITLFLAGGITNCPDWQKEVIKGLEGIDSLVIFNPRRENFPIHDPNASFEQIKWEFDMLEKANIFTMYFSDGESDQPICMYELGRNILRMQMIYPTDWQDRIVITCNEGYKRKNDVLIQSKLATVRNFVNIGDYKNHVDNILNVI